MTTSKKQGDKKLKEKKLANPVSTGGGGVSFENRVQAARLLAMCLGSPLPGFAESKLVELKFQARIQGHHTDDLVCLLENADGSGCRTLLQMKRTLAPREKDKQFAESIGAAWSDFQSSIFSRGQDSIFFVYDTACAGSMKSAITVSNWARFSGTSEEFLRKVEAEGFSNASNRNAIAAIRKIAEDTAGRKLTNDELHSFVKHLNFHSHDLDEDGTPEHAQHLAQIQMAAALVGEAVNMQEVWSTLVASCATANKNAATITFENLEHLIGKRLNGLFARVRVLHASPSQVLSSTSVPSAAKPADLVSSELTRLAGLVEALEKRSVQSSTQDQVPAARASSTNKVISTQLDGIHSRIKELRYRDAAEDLNRIGESLSEFDTHQEARWLLLRGTCRWHLEGSKAAAEDFIRAAELCNDEDKFVAAGIRGLLLDGDAKAAAEAGGKALRDFPDSLAVWQATANARMNLGEALAPEDIPASLRTEPDALQMVAWSRHRRGDKPGAQQAALEALDLVERKNFFTRDTALSMSLDKAAGDGVSAVFQMLSADDKLALERCVSEFEPRDERLWRIQSPEAVAGTATNLANAYLLLGQPNTALDLLKEARAHGIDSRLFLRVEYQGLAAIGQRALAVEIGRAKIKEMPREALATYAQLAGEADDIEAVDQAIEAANLLQPAEPALLRNLSAMRWTVQARKDRPSALVAIRGINWAASESIPELVAASEVLRDAGQATEADALVDRILAIAAEDIDNSNRYLVAQSLLLARRFTQAIPFYEEIAPPGKHSQLHSDLLYCYMRSGQRAKAKHLIDSFPSGWETHQDSRHLAMELGQLAGDWELLNKLIPVEFEHAPQKVRSWLLRVMAAARSSRSVEEIIKDAPVDLVGSTREITQFASLELRHGYKERALGRLYVMRRRRLDSTEVAAAHLSAHLVVNEELPLMEDPVSVGTGTSVTLVDGAGKVQTFTLDPADLPELPATPEFLRQNSKEATVLLGKAVGDELVVDDGQDRVLRVLRVCTAYRRLFELSQTALDAPLAPSPVAKMVLVHNEQTGEPDFSALTNQLKEFNEHANDALNVYASSPITLGGLARLLGRDVLDLVRGWKAEGPQLQVSGGNVDERLKTIEGLETNDGPYLIDGITLVELASLDCLDALAVFSNILVTSQTRDTLEGKLAEAQIERVEGTAFVHDGKLGFSETTDADRRREVALYQSIVDAIRQHCRVVPAYGNDLIAPLVTQLERALSVEELAVLMAAAEQRATVLSLDARLRALAAAMEIPGVWPQVVLMHALHKGRISERTYSLAAIRQMLMNRTFVSIGAEDLLFMTYQGTNWLRFGLLRFKKYLAQPETDFRSAYRVAVEFWSKLATRGPCHIGAVANVLEHLAEGLCRHKDAPGDLATSLFEVALKVFTAGTLTATQHQILRNAVLLGRAAAGKKQPNEVVKVRVLMCSQPPWVTYARIDGKAEDVEAQSAKTAAAALGPSEGDATGISASGNADEPFK